MNARIKGLRALVKDNPLLVVIAGIGFAVSFQTIAHLATVQHMPGWPVLYPILIDVGFLAAIVEARHAIDDDRSDLAPRLLAWSLGALTVYVNAHGSPSGDWLGLTLHVAGPGLWVAFLELARWRKMRRSDSRRERIPLARWFADRPWRVAGMWRRMVLHGVMSYKVACAREEALLMARDLTRAALGRRWRRKAPALLRFHLRTGTLPRKVSEATQQAEWGTPPAMGELVEAWITSALTSTAKAALKVRQERHAIEHATPPELTTPTGTPNGTPRTTPTGTPTSTPLAAPGSRRKARQSNAGDRAKQHAEARRLRADHPEMTLAQIGEKTGLSERTVSRVTGARPSPVQQSARTG